MKMSGSLPKTDDEHLRNGLAVHAADIVHHPDERRIAIVVLRTAKLVDNRAEHTVEPVMAIDRIELVRPRDAHTAEQLLTTALEHRTRGNALPVFVTDDIKEAFEDGAIEHGSGQLHLVTPLMTAVDVEVDVPGAPTEAELDEDEEGGER